MGHETAESILLSRPKPKKRTEAVPDYLIYELVRGKPIYYKGYKDVLNGTKTFEEIMADSKIQAGLKARLPMMIGNQLLEKGYEIAAGEMGFNLPEKQKRAGDIAIFTSENWSWDERYSDKPAEVIIEIDVKAHVEGMLELDYIVEKIEDYLSFGVKKVIWIFTRNRKITVATEQKPWLTFDWDADVEVVEGVKFNLNQIVGAMPPKV